MTVIDEITLNKIIAASARSSTYKNDILKALQSSHITEVAEHYLGKYHDFPDHVLEYLGFSPDILHSFKRRNDDWEFNYKPAISGFRLIPESASHPINSIRLQIPQSPLSVSIGLKLVRDLLSSLESSIQIMLCLNKHHNAEAIQYLIKSWGNDQNRLKLVRFDAVNLFAQDNAITGQIENGETVLLLPRHNTISDDLVNKDPDLETLTTEFGIQVYRSRLFWEGGNILYDGNYCLIGANTIAKNMCRLGLSEHEVKKAFSIEFGIKVLILGDIKVACLNEVNQLSCSGGQADFHIDLDVNLLGLNTEIGQAMVGVVTSDLSDRLIAAVLKTQPLFEQHFVDKHAMKEIFIDHVNKSMQQRSPMLDHYRTTLKANGYQIINLPDLRMVSEFNLFGRINMAFNYTNVIPSADQTGNKRVHMFRYGIDALDEQAAASYQSAGITPHFIGNDVTSNELLQLRGGLHCLYSKLG